MSEYQLMTEDQRDMVKLVKDFLMKEYLPHVSEYEAKGEYPLEFHKKLGELGLFAMDVPEEYGGLGLDAVTTCLIREAIGYVDAGFASSLCSIYLWYQTGPVSRNRRAEESIRRKTGRGTDLRYVPYRATVRF